MRKYLLPESGNFYKANLHCHTNVSDGKWTPEKVKEEYKKMGYSVIAYTDHNIMLPHPDLTDDSFLALTGYEINISTPRDENGNTPGGYKTCHICLIAPNAEDTPSHRDTAVLAWLAVTVAADTAPAETAGGNLTEEFAYETGTAPSLYGFTGSGPSG